jgi:TP901 family phage tail tape measure protein
MADENIVTNIVANADFSDLIANVNKVTTNLAQLKQTLVSTDKALALQAAKIQQNFASTLRSTGQFSTHFVSLSSDVEKFGKNLDSGKLKLRDYYSTWQNHQRTAGGLIRDLAKQQVQLQNSILQPLGRNAEGLMQFNVQVPRGLDLTKSKTALLKQEMQIMNKVIQDGGVQLINWGKNTQWAGRQLTVGLTLPLAAFGKAAADAFKVADQELVRLTKVYGGVAQTSATDLAKVRKEVAQTAKELAQAYGASYTETISLAADIAATGKEGEDLIKSTQETTRLAILGEVDRQEAMKATLSIQTAFKQNTEQLTESINFLNAVENQTSTSLADLVEAIPKAGPIIQSLGGTIEDLALYLTAMKEGGVNASEGANAIKSSLASLINPTKVAKEQFLGFGISLEDIVNSNAGNLTAMMLDLQASLDKLDPLQKSRAIEQLFGKFQFARMSALFENLGKQGSQTLQVLDLMKASSQDLANVAGRELAQITESASGKYRRALEGLKADLAGVGESFLNIQTALIGVIDKVIDFGAKLPDPIKKILTLVGGLTALAGPAIMLTGVLANFFGYIIKGVAHFKALFKGGEGWKLLTPEILAAQKAGNLMEATFYSDAKAANILGQALANLNIELDELSRKASSGTISAQPVISTVAGNAMNMGEREVIATHPLLSPRDTRSFSHLNPLSRMTAEEKAAQTMFGVVPGAPLVNQKISNNPQMYMSGDLPKVEGLTSIRGVSTGVVAGEAAKFHSMTGALGMQSQQELELLRREVAATGLITQSLSDSYQALLPEMTQLTNMAAAESAEIVAELQARKITMDQARAKIAALNATVESMMGEVATGVAATQGRTINLTQLPLVNQPAFDPVSGKANMKELTRPRNRTLLNKIAQSLGVKTFGAPYSIETTRPKRFNMGGKVFFNNGDQVPGFGNTDTVPAMLTPGEFVIRKGVAQQDPEGMKALNDGQAMVVPVQQRNLGGVIASLRNKMLAVGGSRGVTMSSKGQQRTSGFNAFASPGARPGGYGYSDFSSPRFFNTRAGREVSRLYNARPLKRVRGTDGKIDKRQSEVNIHAVSEEFLNTHGMPTGTASTPDLTGAQLVALGATGKIDPNKKYRVLPAMSVRGSQHFNEKLNDKTATSADWVKIGPGNLTDLAMHLHHELGLPPAVINNILASTANKINYKILSKRSAIDEQEFARIVFNSAEESVASNFKYKTNNWLGMNAGGMVPSMGGSVTMQGGRTIPVPAQSGKYKMGGMVKGYRVGGGIPSLAASTISRLTSRWKPKEQFWPQGHQYMLGNQDPLHGPLQIGRSMVPRPYAKDPEYTREVLFKDDRFARQNVMPQFPIGTMEDRGKYILRQYMAGNYGVLNTPGATEAMKTLSKKFSGTLYRGIRLSDNRENPIPQNIIAAIEKARLTGDNSGLMGQEFIMRRSSWSAKSGIAGMFAPGYGKDPSGKSILLEANVKNRNVVPASEIFPDVKFAPPFGQKLTTNNYRSEHESIFGGKFKVVGFSGGKLQLETVVDGARAMGGPVNSGRPYLVGENGPEVFVPRNSGGIIPGYQEGGAVGAFTAGLRNPYGKGIASSMAGKQMGFGAQMGLGMAGGIAGQMVGGNAGMAIMMASNILPMMTALKGFGGLIPSVTKVAGILGRLTIPGAVIGGLTAAVMLVNKFRRDAENAGEVNRAMFGGTKDQLAEVGISYTSISDRIKDMNTQLELNKAKIESSYNSFTKSGIPGLTLTIQQLKDGIEKAKTSAKETVNLFNNADTSQVNELATSMKAQYVAMGMSVEEATNTIYTLVAASNKSKQALGAISSSGFKDIIDQASAATSQVEKLGKVIEGSLRFNAEEFNTGMDSVLNSLNAYKNSLIGAKDSSGKIKTETEALAETIEKIKGTTGATSTINKQNLEAYKLQNLEMASILGKSESILSIFSKYQLVAAGLSDVMDISAMSGAQAISVAAGYQKVKDAASAVVAETTIGKLVASRLKNQRNLQGLIKNSASQDSSYYNNAIKQKQKLIEILEEERKKRLSILDIQEQSQSFETAIKQTQIKYQEALASGNMAQAAQEQLNIQKLRADRERELARKSINDKFDAERKKLEDEIERLQNQKDAKDKAASNAVASSQRATEDLQAAKDFEAKIVGIVSKYGGKFSADAQKALAVAFNDAKASKDAGLAAAATQMEKQYITGSKTFQSSPGIAPVTVTKDKYQSMFENLSIETLAKAGSNDKFSKAVESFVSAVNVFAGKEKPVVTTGRTTGQTRSSGAVDVMAPKGGTVEKIGGITYIYDNMGKRYDITTPAGIKLRAVFKKAMGGYISGAGNGTSDSIPAMLSNGEYVINAKSVQAAGIPMLDRINKMAMGGPVYNIPAYSMGGRVKYNAGGLANSSNSLYNINVTLNGTDLSPDDVANAIERKMRMREATIGRGRNY